MDTIFGTSSTISNNENQSSVTARKPVQSTRKPLADRKLGAQQAPEPQKCEEINNQFYKIDTCSYKNVPDNYNDLVGPAELCKFSSVSFTEPPKTPPPKTTQIIDYFGAQQIENIHSEYKFILHENIDNLFGQFKMCDFEVPLSPLELNFEF